MSTLPVELQRTILDMSRDPQINVAIYRYEDRRLEVHIYKVNGRIEVKKQYLSSMQEPFHVTSLDALRSFIAPPITNIVNEDMKVVVFRGSSPPKVKLSTEASWDRLTGEMGGVQDHFLIDLNWEEELHEYGDTMRVIADYTWDILH